MRRNRTLRLSDDEFEEQLAAMAADRVHADWSTWARLVLGAAARASLAEARRREDELAARERLKAALGR